jgi:AraC family transcriptional activator of pobA
MATPAIPTHNLYSQLGTEVPFEYVALSEKQNYDPLHYHRHSYYEIFIFEKGGGKHQIDFDVFDVHDLSVHVVSPGQVHMLQRELNSYGHVILFSREFYELNSTFNHQLQHLPFLNNNTSVPIIQIPPNEKDLFKNYFTNIQRTSKLDYPEKDPLIVAHLHALLMELKRVFDSNQTKTTRVSEPGLIRDFRILAENHFSQYHKPSDYALLLNITVAQLNDKVKKSLGITASQLINERLVLEIKRILLFNDLNVNEIAYLLNFEDASYFIRFFKQHTGHTPSEYRKLLRKKYEIDEDTDIS